MNADLKAQALSLERAILKERPEEVTERIEEAVAYKELWMDPVYLKFAEAIRTQRFTIEEIDSHLVGNEVFVEHIINTGGGVNYRLWVQGVIGMGLKIAMLKADRRLQQFGEREFKCVSLDYTLSQKRFRLALLRIAADFLPEA